MKAIVAHAANDVRLDSVGEAIPGRGQVSIVPAYGGICGSDLHYYREGRVGPYVLTEPLVLGHEVVGIVATDTREVGGLVPGTPVAVHPAAYDTASASFRRDRPNISGGVRYLGSAASMPHTQGAFSERLIVDVGQVRPLPSGLPLRRAVLAEPLAVALHALARAGDLTGARVLVSGAGSIGLLAARAALSRGVISVSSCDVLAEPLARAEALGADATYRVGVDEIPAQSFDVVIEASGATAALTQAIRAVASGGTIVQVGMLPGAPAPYALAELVSREIDVRGSFRFDTELDDAIVLLERDPAFDSVITHEFAADQVIEALRVASNGAESSKVVLRLWGDSR
ncbi:L-idonate 5-dehydrogenase [Microbacterium kribbense]|uniref:L-idonate 5-dehydrogenase n=1 Tax=Microbacterium kribbense TaxID=433645 RepID=A0ABP7GS89_9MICO